MYARKVRAQSAVVLLAKHINIVCSDTEYIKQPCFFDVYLTWSFFRFKS